MKQLEGGVNNCKDFSVLFRRIVFIDCMSESERKHTKHVPILKHYIEGFEDTFRVDTFVAKSKTDFESIFNTLKYKTKHDIYFLLHIISHGSEEGLKIVNKDSEKIMWAKLAELLKDINYIMKNQLVLNLTVCNSDEIFKYINLKECNGFSEIIAFKNSLRFEIALAFNLMFYDYIICEGCIVQDLKTKIKKDFNINNLVCLTEKEDE